MNTIPFLPHRITGIRAISAGAKAYVNESATADEFINAIRVVTQRCGLLGGSSRR